MSIISKILAVIYSVIIAVTGIFSGVANFIASDRLEIAKTFEQAEYGEDRLVPQKDADGNWTFTTDRPLKIVQITDVHIGGGLFSAAKDKKALNAVAAMIKAEKPDLVIATGDVSYPVSFQSGTCNNKVSAEIFIAMMESLGAYWTICFGNHDTEAFALLTREQIADMYSDESLEYCLFENGPDNVDGCGNQIINVKNSSGIITQSIYLIDSHSYIEPNNPVGSYDCLHENQIEWYKQNVQKFNSYNKTILPTAGTVKSLMFMHIPIQEYDTAWKEYKANGYQDSENVKFLYGVAGEPNEKVCCSDESDEMFETILSLGSTQGVFSGHDHLNTYSIEYKGVRLTYGMSIDYLAYVGIDKEGAQRGCTVITANPDGTFDCVAENYYQDKYVSRFEKEKVNMK